MEGVLAHAHPDIELQPGDRRLRRPHGALPRPRRHPRQYFRDVADVWDELRIVPGEFRQAGDTILVTGRVSARSPARIVAGSTGWIWRVADGLVTYARVYPSAAEAMAAFEGRGAI